MLREFSVHDSLRESAEKTFDVTLSRLAVTPLVLEERGLDTTPGAIKIYQPSEMPGLVEN